MVEVRSPLSKGKRASTSSTRTELGHTRARSIKDNGNSAPVDCWRRAQLTGSHKHSLPSIDTRELLTGFPWHFEGIQ